jgi:hypothetical protein
VGRVRGETGHQRNKGRNKKLLDSHENKNTTYKNLWDTAKAVQWGKFTFIPSRTTPTTNAGEDVGKREQ